MDAVHEFGFCDLRLQAQRPREDARICPALKGCEHAPRDLVQFDRFGVADEVGGAGRDHLEAARLPRGDHLTEVGHRQGRHFAKARRVAPCGPCDRGVGPLQSLRSFLEGMDRSGIDPVRD